MTIAGLEQEMAAACAAVRQADLDGLRALGVSINTIADMGTIYFPFGVTEAEPIGNGLYQPGVGQPFLILPILENNELVDLCAFQGAQPDTWHLRTGAAWCLGMVDSLSEAQVHLCGRPLDWLRGGGKGICILDWSSPEIRSLAAMSEVTCSDPRAARLLQAALDRSNTNPRIRLEDLRYAA